MNLIQRLQRTFFTQSAPTETDNTFYLGSDSGSAELRERPTASRAEILRQALEAWRVNPLARRLVGLTTQYVVGGGILIHCDHPATQNFLHSWWNHRLNQLHLRVFEWCDELTRSGELFLLLTTDASGMTYVRAIPAAEITEIETAANDLQQETAYLQATGIAAQPEKRWLAYAQEVDAGDLQGEYAQGEFTPVMLHYAINRAVGAVRGESDLGPLLKWLARYASWLEDRARLNRYRNSFVYVVKSHFQSEAERRARQQTLAAVPPAPGSILVVDESESWEVLNPQLQSQDAGEDGLALKKMIAAGGGVPLHFLAEPEGSNRSTAESAGGPTFRHYQQRQEFFCQVLADVAHVAVARRALLDAQVDPLARIEAQGADLSARDNASLAVATATITAALTNLYAAGLIDAPELLRMVYRFAGEVVDVDGLIERAKAAGAPASLPTATGTGTAPHVRIDPITGEPRGVQ